MADFNQLNDRFCVDSYISLDDDLRISFRCELEECILELSESYKIVKLNREVLLAYGLKVENKTAVIISYLQERLSAFNYDRTFHFRDTIDTLFQELLIELFKGKQIFYPLSNDEVALDSGYVTFVLGKFPL